MCLVHDQHVPELGGQPVKHLGLLDEVDRRDDNRFNGPGVHAERQ